MYNAYPTVSLLALVENFQNMKYGPCYICELIKKEVGKKYLNFSSHCGSLSSIILTDFSLIELCNNNNE